MPAINVCRILVTEDNLANFDTIPCLCCPSLPSLRNKWSQHLSSQIYKILHFLLIQTLILPVRCLCVCVLKSSHHNNWKWLKWQLLHAFPSSVQKKRVEGVCCPTAADNYNFDFFMRPLLFYCIYMTMVWRTENRGWNICLN